MIEIAVFSFCDPERALYVPIETAFETAAEKAPQAWMLHVAKLRALLAYMRSTELRGIYHGSIRPYPPSVITVFGGQRGTNVDIWVDFSDKANVDEGAASLHYRMQIQRDGSKLTRDVRTQDPAVVARQIGITLGPGRRVG